MSRKDYVALAAALAVNKPRANGAAPVDAATEVWKRTVHSVADTLAFENARFNRRRFLEAAGIPQQTAAQVAA